MERLAYMLEDAGASVLVTQARLVEQLPAHDAHVVRIDADWNEIATQPAGAVRNTTLPENLAYVIYTSGSTGKPKGVSLQHASAAAMLCWAKTTFSRVDTASDDCLDFDMFLICRYLSCLYPLSTGGQVILANSLR